MANIFTSAMGRVAGVLNPVVSSAVNAYNTTKKLVSGLTTPSSGGDLFTVSGQGKTTVPNSAYTVPQPTFTPSGGTPSTGQTLSGGFTIPAGTTVTRPDTIPTPVINNEQVLPNNVPTATPAPKTVTPSSGIYSGGTMPTTPAVNPYAGTDMDTKLNEAYARVQAGTASAIDQQNIDYASGKGWSPKQMSVEEIQTLVSPPKVPTEAESGVFSGGKLSEYYTNEQSIYQRQADALQKQVLEAQQLTQNIKSPDFASMYKEQYAQNVAPLDTEIANKSAQLNSLDANIRALDDAVRAEVGGRASEAVIQAEVARRSKPLLLQRQGLVDELTTLDARRTSLAGDIENTMNYAQQTFTNEMSINSEKREIAENALKSVQSVIEKGIEASQKEIENARETFKTFLTEVPEFVASLDANEMAQLQQGIIPASALSKLQTAVQNTASSEAYKNLPAKIQEYEYAVSQGYQGTMQDYFTEEAKTASLTPAQIQSTINGIVNQFDGEPIVKNYNVVADGYSFASALANKEKLTSADNIGMLYAFAKALDPNSVVREGEYATVQKYAQSWAETFGFNAQRILANKEFLSRESIQNMVNVIGTKYQTAEQAYQSLANEYTRRIEDAKSGVIGGSISNYSQGWNTGSTKTEEQVLQEIRAQYPELKDVSDDLIKEAVPDRFRGVQSKTLNLAPNYEAPPVQTNVNSLIGSGIVTGYGSDYWGAGLDYVVSGGKNAPVRAPTSGKVVAVRTGYNGGFGNQVRIRTSDGKEVWLSHLNQVNVREGQSINPSTVLGLQGNTGKTYGQTGIHVDITMPKSNGTYYTAREVANFLNVA